MTPSTTNTAAQEVVLPELPMQWKSEAPGTCLYTAEQMHLYAIAAINLTLSQALTQQQGGEQEVRELLGEPWHEEISGMVRGNPLFDEQQQWVRLEDATAAVTAALRSKPAASEGDVCGRVEIRGDYVHLTATVEQLHVARAAGHGAPIYTSKQAAGEAVAGSVIKASAFLGDGHPMVRVVYWWPKDDELLRHTQFIGPFLTINQAEQIVTLLTPPRHPADEGMAYRRLVERMFCPDYGDNEEGRNGWRLSADFLKRGNEPHFYGDTLDDALQAGTPT